MQRILIPTDLTLYSLQLIKHAVHLVKGETCHITLVHSVSVPDSITELLLLPRATADAERPSPEFIGALDRLMKKYALEIHSIELECLYGDSPALIHDLVKRKKIDLALNLVPLAGSSGTLNPINSLLQEASCPMLYIPDFVSINGFRKIVFVLDTADKASMLPTPELIHLLCRHEYHLTFLLLFKLDKDKDKLKKVLDHLYASPTLVGVNYSVHLQHEAGGRSSGVTSFLKEHEVDLVVTCKKRSVLQSLRLSLSAQLRPLPMPVPHLAVT